MKSIKKALSIPFLLAILATTLPPSVIAHDKEHHHGRDCDINIPGGNSTKLQEAITAPANAGKVICLGKGTYLPSTSGDRGASFTVTIDHLTIRGKSAKQTILSGDIGVPGVNTDNSYHVMTVIGPYHLKLEKLTIADGYSELQNTDSGSTPTGLGAGLYIDSGDVTLDSVAVRDNVLNSPSTNPQDFAGGGGVFARNSHLVIKKSLFERNKAHADAGLGIFGKGISTTVPSGAVNIDAFLAAAGTHGSLRVDDSIFRKNAAISNGAIGAIGLDAAKIDNSRFESNTAEAFGGGVILINTIDTKVIRSKFVDNQAARHGGLDIEPRGQASAGSIPFTLLIDDSLFRNNRAVGSPSIVSFDGALGLIIGFSGVPPTLKLLADIRNSKFIDNTALQGSAINQQSGTATVSNTLFKGNKGTFSTYIADLGADVALRNVIFKDNSVTADPVFGPPDSGGLELVEGSHATRIDHVKFINNSTTHNGGAIEVDLDDIPSFGVSSIGEIIDSTFIGNTATGLGNAIWCDANQDIGPIVDTFFGPKQDIVGCHQLP